MSGSKKGEGEGEGEGGSRPKPKFQAVRTLAQQWDDYFFCDEPWDDDLLNVPYGVGEDEEGTIDKMMPDVLTMAEDADRMDTPVGSYPPAFFHINSQLTRCTRLLFHIACVG